MFELTPGNDLHDLKTLHINNFSLKKNKGRVLFQGGQIWKRALYPKENNFPRKSFPLTAYLLVKLASDK